MSDEERVSSFLEDDRVKFVEGNVRALLRLHGRAWGERAATGDFQALLKNFFDKETVIFISASNKAGLVASKEVTVCIFLFVYIVFNHRKLALIVRY